MSFDSAEFCLINCLYLQIRTKKYQYEFKIIYFGDYV